MHGLQVVCKSNLCRFDLRLCKWLVVPLLLRSLVIDLLVFTGLFSLSLQIPSIKFVAVGVVGSLVGAITGALIGLATESGLLRGSGIGAITGTVFSIEVVESSHNLWNSRDCGSWSLLHLMNALSLPFMETLDLYETDGNTKGMPMDEVEKLPKSQVTARGSLDESGERISCSVCLQDLRVGEMARRLPICCHMFHLPCIDTWLIRHGSCPLCRREVFN
ncbi:NEP1-interacting protein 1-like isoform X2 [Zingiber officinale]|uniref:NEP1-interacting protein 1-like isoform X2 n=1 Tax=Zingiber officinale TaxID=94328 RepID=UPI001C4B2AC2|nr:NEP1-interacting protein 1-like isoform X2 [Zingiber officinale]XP_042384777.1 NEP1-interacting protein 1-like isoform X2 [Zingiber officinale]XP_042384778.1 NEP1-interacting protein 1-like isoform X2 [Zingiber officinale]